MGWKKSQKFQTIPKKSQSQTKILEIFGMSSQTKPKFSVWDSVLHLHFLVFLYRTENKYYIYIYYFLIIRELFQPFIVLDLICVGSFVFRSDPISDFTFVPFVSIQLELEAPKPLSHQALISHLTVCVEFRPATGLPLHHTMSSLTLQPSFTTQSLPRHRSLS